MTLTVSPFDGIRTNLMNQPTNGKIFNGFLDDCFAKKTIAKEDGPMSWWHGFIPIWARFAPTTLVQHGRIEEYLKERGKRNVGCRANCNDESALPKRDP